MKQLLATFEQKTCFENFLKHWFNVDQVVQAAIASDFITKAMQNFSNYHKINLSIRNQKDINHINILSTHTEIINRNLKAINKGILFAAFNNLNTDFDIVAIDGTAKEIYQPYQLNNNGQQLGIVPLVAGLIYAAIGGITLVVGVWSVSHLINSQSKKIIAKNAKKALNADINFSKGNPAIARKWLEYKKINAEILKQQSKKADKINNSGGLFSRIFGEAASNTIGVVAGLGIFAIILKILTNKRR
jgi:hypothetical protein